MSFMRLFVLIFTSCKTKVKTCISTRRQADASHLYSLSLSCIMLDCNGELDTTAALSTIALALNNAAGHCAEATTPPPHSVAARISKFLLTLLLWRVTNVQFSLGRVNTINRFTQHHQMFVFSHCSPKIMHFWVIALYYRCLCGCI